MNEVIVISCIVIFLIILAILMGLLNKRKQNVVAEGISYGLIVLAIMLASAALGLASGYPQCSHVSAATYVLNNEIVILYKDKCIRINGDIYYENIIYQVND